MRACVRASTAHVPRPAALKRTRASRPGLLIVLHAFFSSHERRVPAAMLFLHGNIATHICIVRTGKKPTLITRYYCHYRGCYCRRHWQPSIVAQSLIRHSIKRLESKGVWMVNVSKGFDQKILKGERIDCEAASRWRRHVVNSFTVNNVYTCHGQGGLKLLMMCIHVMMKLIQ